MKKIIVAIIFSAVSLVTLLAASPAKAQLRDAPYWATIRDSATTLNMRVGPGRDYKIAWVYRRPGLPVKVVRTLEGWRLIEDPAGDQGWVVNTLLSPVQGALVMGDEPVAIYAAASADSSVRWRAEPGVVVKLGVCNNGWCEVDIEGRKGWVKQDRLWGAQLP
jgi:SH3-like domain-containing protein